MENMLEVDGRDDDDDLRDAEWRANVADFGEGWAGDWLAVSGDDGCGREGPARGEGGDAYDDAARGDEGRACAGLTSGGDSWE